MKLLDELKEDIENGKFEELKKEDVTCDCLFCTTFDEVMGIIDDTLLEEYQAKGELFKATKSNLLSLKCGEEIIRAVQEQATKDSKESKRRLKEAMRLYMTAEMIIDILADWRDNND